MKNKKALTALFLALMSFTASPLAAQAQDTDFMRSIGHIYVVIAVIIAIFIGLVFFLIYLDRRLTKLERDVSE